MSTCKRCGAAIKWIRMKSGKNMPVDPQLYAGGDPALSVLITEDGETKSDAAENPDTVGHVPHWATCPHANEFRRKSNGS